MMLAAEEAAGPLPEPASRRGLTVLLLMESMEVAGAEQLVLSIVRRLDRSRFRPIIGCLTVPGPLAPEVEEAGVELVALGKRPGFDASILRKLMRLMRAKRIDVLHTHVWPADVWGRVAARAVGVPVAITTEHNVCDWKSWRHFAVDRWLARWSTRIVCVSEAVLEFYRDRAHLPVSKLLRIYNGIDPAPFLDVIDVAGKRSSLGAGGDRVVMTAVGRLIPQKTHHHFLEALRDVRRSCPAIQGWIVGGGPLRSDLEARAEALGLVPDGVRFLGERRDVPDLLKASNAFVLPTAVREGLSLSVLEAMAAGLPIVATDVGGNREIIEDGRTGLLVPPGDGAALGAAMLRVVEDPGRARGWGRAARTEMLSRFSLDAMVREYERLYELDARAEGLLS
jgi:glycosyltransferase involved in cell wall biosynthesis